jgi:hypothetical protein
MGRGGDETMLQRVENTRARQAGHTSADMHGKRPADWADVLRDAPTEPTAPPIKHCWYNGPHGRQAALLLSWRNTGGHYDGRIAVASLEPDGWAVIELWVAQEMLAPA